MKKSEIKEIVKKGYAKIAKNNTSCCWTGNSCCGVTEYVQEISEKTGYNKSDFEGIPSGSNLGLGCGNPVAISGLKEGEFVLDLGSGAGFDCFLAANKVGKSGKVIGIDITPEMVKKARENANKGKYKNVEFISGEIENLPFPDNYFDVVMSNCVINLSTDKRKVFKEIFRVLKPGGRIIVSDIVLLKKLPDFIKKSPEFYISCISGAILKDQYIKIIRTTGFKRIKINSEVPFSQEIDISDCKIKKMVISPVSITISGFKPLFKCV